eukprot:15325336-Heterocapsa_arctica.AAC.1
MKLRQRGKGPRVRASAPPAAEPATPTAWRMAEDGPGHAVGQKMDLSFHVHVVTDDGKAALVSLGGTWRRCEPDDGLPVGPPPLPPPAAPPAPSAPDGEDLRARLQQFHGGNTPTGAEAPARLETTAEAEEEDAE